MIRLLARMVLLAAVLLMPFGMNAVPAASPQHHSAAMPMQHCPEQAPAHQPKSGFAECTMACATALPASDAGGAAAFQIAGVPPEAAAIQQLHGLDPDTATPPPKHF